jgi:hypothetical protein
MIDDKKSTLPKLQEDLYVWEEKHKKCQSVEKLSKKLSLLMNECSWSFLISWEKDMEATVKEKNAIIGSKQKCLNSVEEHEANYNKASAELDLVGSQINDLTSEIKKAIPKEKEMSQRLKEASDEFKLKENDRKKLKMLLTKKEKDKVCSFLFFKLK